jgi:hypothetical protein
VVRVAAASSRTSGRSRAARPKRLGSETPRIFTPPLRPLTPATTLGFAVIEFAREVLGIEPLPWQKWLLTHALELLPDGTFRFRTVVVLVARQNGKSTLAQILALFFLYVRQVSLVIGTAQNLDIAEEVWRGAVDMAQDVPELDAMINKIVEVNGKKALELWNDDRTRTGHRYRVQAANRRGGRGLSSDLCILDELREHQTWAAWGAITKTTLARAYAQVWALSNAGDATSVVLRHLRQVAHLALGDPDKIATAVESTAPDEAEETEPSSLGIFEWSAAPDRAVDDRDGWAESNPSLGHTIFERTLAAALESDDEFVFRTEVRCQWPGRDTVGPFPTGAWKAGEDPASAIPEDAALAWCLDVSSDRGAAHIAVAGHREDGDVHAEIAASKAGIEWALDWFRERATPDNPMRVCAQTRGAPVSNLLADLGAIPGVELVDWSGPQLGAAFSELWDLVHAHLWEPSEDETPDARPRRLWHLPQPVLDIAADNAQTKAAGDGVVIIDRAKSPVDAAPLAAITGAVWLAGLPPEEAPPSVYEERDLMLA